MRADAVVERAILLEGANVLLLSPPNNGPLEAAHAHIDDNRFDVVECGTDK